MKSRPCGCKKGHPRFGRCRISRPLCRKMRKCKGLCGCSAYHYPHRKGSGLCNPEKMNAICYGVGA